MAVIPRFRYLSCALNSIYLGCHRLSRDIMPKNSVGGFYAVRKGRVPGVYNTWDECQEHIKGFSGARYKKFPSQEEAETFVTGDGKKEPYNAAPPTYTRPKDTAPGYSTPKLADVPMSRAKKGETGEKRRYCTSICSDGPHDTSAPSDSLSTSDLDQLKSISTNISNSVVTLEKHLDDGTTMLRHLRVKTASFSGTTKATLQLYDDMLLQAQNQLKPLETLMSQSKKFCHDLENGKRSRSPSTGGSYESGPTTSKKAKSQESTGQVQGEKLKSVDVYTDGCCHNNGRGKPCAGVGVFWDTGHNNNLAERLMGRQTNNRAEIHAARRAIEQALGDGYDQIVIYTDSMFLINCITKWIFKWKKNGWKLTNGTPVINRTDLEELEEAMEGIIVHWKHVKAHVGIPGNEAADKLANRGARLPYIKNGDECDPDD